MMMMMTSLLGRLWGSLLARWLGLPCWLQLPSGNGSAMVALLMQPRARRPLRSNDSVHLPVLRHFSLIKLCHLDRIHFEFEINNVSSQGKQFGGPIPVETVPVPVNPRCRWGAAKSPS